MDGEASHHFLLKPEFKYTVGKKNTLLLDVDDLFINQRFLDAVLQTFFVYFSLDF